MADLVLPVEALPIQKKKAKKYNKLWSRWSENPQHRRSTAIHTVAKLKRQKAV